MGFELLDNSDDYPLIRDYLNFRSFIFGTAPKEGNPMFPEGVVYAGVGDEKPTYFRGESGANDSSVFLFHPSRPDNG